MKALGLLALLAACGSFEDPTIVKDLRVLAASASIPEQTIDVDPAMPIDVVALEAQIDPIDVCWLVADPGEARALPYRMTICPTSADERCNSDEPEYLIAAGELPDPDTTPGPTYPCGTVQPDDKLLAVLLAELEGDTLSGLAGIDVSVTLTIEVPDEESFAAKTVRITPKIPASRTGNANPTLDGIDVAITRADAGEPEAPIRLPIGKCIDQAAPLQVHPRDKLRLTPVEAAGARETYTVPTLDGSTSTLTEALTYQWLAGNGDYSSGSTGGPRDFAGNPAPLFTDWRAPEFALGTDDPIAEPTNVSLWVIQRDERFGATWYESCVRVVP